MSAAAPRAGALLETVAEVRRGRPDRQQPRHAEHSGPYQILSAARLLLEWG